MKKSIKNFQTSPPGHLQYWPMVLLYWRQILRDAGTIEPGPTLTIVRNWESELDQARGLGGECRFLKLRNLTKVRVR